MSAFGIWAIILTGCYVVYYPALIFLDLFGMKGQKKDGVEEFDTGSGDAGVSDEEEEETPTVVVDTGNGYRVGDEEEQPADEDEEELPNEEAPQVPLTPEQKQQEEFVALKNRIDDQLKQGGETVNPDYQQTLNTETYLMMMNQPLNKKTRIKRDKCI